MTTDEILGRLFLDIGILLVLGQILGVLLARIGQPRILGYLLTGFVLGPTLLGRISGPSLDYLFPDEVRSQLSVVGSIGLMLFTFGIGARLDVERLRRRGGGLASISAGAFLVPLVAGAALALVLYPDHKQVDADTVDTLPFVLFFSTCMAVTAFPVLVAILDDRGLRDTWIGQLSIGAAAIQDAAGWLLLTVALASLGGSDILRTAVETLALGLAAMAVGPRLLVVSGRVVGSGREQETVVALAFVAACAGASQLIGLHVAIGAFLAGLTLARGDGRERILQLQDQIWPATALLLPIYFLTPGLQIDLFHLRLLETLAILAVATAAKLLGTGLSARAVDIPWRDAAALGALMNTRGLVELVVISIGFSEGVLDQSLFGELALMALATTFMTGPALTLLRSGGAPPRPQTPGDASV